MTHSTIDLTTYGSDGILVRLDSLRARLASEPNEAVKMFLVLEIGDVIAEMKRRTDARITAIASAKLS